MKKEDVICGYLMNDKAVIAEMLYDTISKYEEQKSCDGCINKPNEGMNYPMICGQCKRFYGDLYGMDAEDYE